MSELISDQEVSEFCQKLEHFRGSLSQPQQDLLLAILKIAWRVTAPEEELTFEWDRNFKPKEAELILSYKPLWPGGASGDATPVAMIPRMIKGLIR